MNRQRWNRALGVLAGFAVCAAVLMGCLSDRQDGARPDTRGSAAGVSASDSGEFCRGQSWQTLRVDGQERRALVRAPRDWDGKTKLPVIYQFHGLGSQADWTLAYTGLAELADEFEFVVVAPQALGAESRWDYRTPPENAKSDLGYVKDLMADVGERECIDPDRQFVTGFSNGSAMSFALACDGSFDFSGYAGVAATFYEPACSKAPPAPMVYFHGTADQVVPFDGGQTPLEPVEPADQTMRSWAKKSGCGKAKATKMGADVQRLSWRSCTENPLDFYIISGGGHTWPGASLDAPNLGKTTQNVNASDVMIEFFGLDR